jgi:radical SAM superfamily enzyme YgiQ (UPF0313 family)
MKEGIQGETRSPVSRPGIPRKRNVGEKPYLKDQAFLVLPPIDENYSRLKTKYPPLGLLSIATYAKREAQGIAIRILDGQIMSQDEIEHVLSSSPSAIVGISTSLLTYENSLRLARIAKEKGAKVYLGGHYATTIPDRILLNRDFIDGVVAGDGEQAFSKILLGNDQRDIENLVFRENGRIVSNERTNLDLNGIPLPDYGLIDDLDKYANSSVTFKKIFISYAQKGCLWREKTGGCLFCARQDSRYRRKSPETYWKEIVRLGKDYSADLIFEVADSFATDRDYIATIFEAKPMKETPPLRIFSRTTDITEETARMLKGINVFEVFVGIESGDSQCLKALNKGTSPGTNLRAARLLREYDIKFFPSVILGNPGETIQTVKTTITHLEELCRVGDVERVYGQFMIPYPGSRVFDMLMAVPELKEKYAKTDLFDLKDLQQEWADHFCHVTYEEMLENIEKANLAKVFSTPSLFKTDLARA